MYYDYFRLTYEIYKYNTVTVNTHNLKHYIWVERNVGKGDIYYSSRVCIEKKLNWGNMGISIRNQKLLHTSDLQMMYSPIITQFWKNKFNGRETAVFF